MRWSIGKKLGAGFGVALLLFTLVAWFSYQNITQSIEVTDRVQHTREVLVQLGKILSLLHQAETAQRGYIITGEQAYLDPYAETVAAVERTVNRLQQLTAGDLNQQQQLDILEPLITKRLALLQTGINLRKNRGLAEATAFIQAGEGAQSMDAVRAMIDQMENEEQQLLEQRMIRRNANTNVTLAFIGYGTGLVFLITALIGFGITRNLTQSISELVTGAERIGSGQLAHRVVLHTKDELGTLAGAFNRMAEQLQQEQTAARLAEQHIADENWLKTNLAKFASLLQGQRHLPTMARLIMSELPPIVSAQHGAFYLLESNDNQSVLRLFASYAYVERKNLANRFTLGEGLVGQCALEKKPILLTHVPADYIRITSGLGDAAPLNVIVLPVLFDEHVVAVIELASFERFRPLQQTFLEQLTESLGIVLTTVRAAMRTEELLRESQAQAEELQSQQEELRQTNEELEEKTRLLSEQNAEVARKNQEIDQARRALEEKAEQLALTSKYKSEFLASMSHELRTPLNSLLILSQQLAENGEGNLTARQVEFARTIHGSGTDLLNLINDILDLSKIESGTVAVEVGQALFTDLRDHVERTFRHVAEAKGLTFVIELAPNLPSGIETDVGRLQQVLRNLLANACKFTEQGHITLRVEVATGGWSLDHKELNRAGTVVAFAVQDTGIGIPLDKQKIIFEAFQQADTGTSRKYGGTGLGLAISREIATLLGGELRLASEPGKGSTFTLYVPQPFVRPALLSRTDGRTPMLEANISGSDLDPACAIAEPMRRSIAAPSVSTPDQIADDRNDIRTGDQVLLIVDDDPTFARTLLDMAHAKGFKGIHASRGATTLTLAREFKPTAITLDLILPDMDGWTVLDRLKLDPVTQSIPVHIISADEDRLHGLERGAFAFLTKPVTREALDEALAKMLAFTKPHARKLLVVEDDAFDRQAILEVIGNGDVQVTAVGTGKEALAALHAEHFDCMVLDLRLPDISGFQVLDEMRKEPCLRDLPVVVNTGRELTPAEETQLRDMAKSIIVKGARSPERLLAETALFLHRVVANLPAPKRRMLEQLYQSDAALTGRQVLIVDDDIRNIFALTSVLERHQMVVQTAENGREALERLQTIPGTDIVLMDIMMPEMDGYDTMRAIRAVPQFKALPIIALTAKAMKGDREKCLEAGASDYITKPVNLEQLLSLLRVWLYR